MALGGEVGELCLEIDPLFETDTDTIELMGVAHTRLRNEVGDVALYLLRLCDVLRIDPAEAFGPALSHTETSELCPIAGIPAALAQAVCRLNGSTGLVLEVFQWEESTHTALPSRMTELELNRRLRSVATSLIALADFVGVDVFDAARAKLAANEQRYPVDLSRGRAVSTRNSRQARARTSSLVLCRRTYTVRSRHRGFERRPGVALSK